MHKKLAAIVLASGAAIAILSGCGHTISNAGMVPVNVSFTCPAHFTAVVYCDPTAVYADATGHEMPMSTYAQACVPNYARPTHVEPVQTSTANYTSVTAFFYCPVSGIPAHIIVTYNCPLGADPTEDGGQRCRTLSTQDYADGRVIANFPDATIAARCTALGQAVYTNIPTPKGVRTNGHKYASVTYACH